MCKIKNKALVIGINNYFKNINSLSGCINDAKLFSKTLLNCGFKTKNIKFLFDEFATRDNILKSVKWLQKGKGKKYFYFAGHGSQTIDLNKDELDGLDEIFITYDSFILDDEINEISKKKDIIFVFDSCHSGTGNREIQYGEKKRRIRTVFQPDGFEYYEENFSRKKKTKEMHKYISACSEKQVAQELDIEGIRHGVFTYTLCYLINKYPKYQFKKIFKLLKEELNEYGQTPQTNIKENMHVL